MNESIRVGDLSVGNLLPFTFIGGPCVIESEDHALTTAEAIKAVTDRLGIGFIYKSSFDKANRSSIDSFRGVGIHEGLAILNKVRSETGVPLLSDVHSPEEAKAAGEVLDVLQIPAFLCRQTDLLVSAGKTGKVVNVKKGQFMAPLDMKNAVVKVKSSGSDKVMLTERGTTFGYNNLIVDMRSFAAMASLGAPVVFDAGHSVQSPGSLGISTGGDRNSIPLLARSAIAAGVAAIFLETHPDPDNAPCDGPNMWPLNRLEELLVSLMKIDRTVKT